MRLTRRHMITTGTAALIAAPGFAVTRLGEMTLTSVSDGALTLPAGMIFDGLDAETIDSISAEFGLTETLRPPCNVTFVEHGERRILFDVGAGPEFMSTAGFLLDALATLGFGPEDITDVIFTHAHPDHIWGLVDDFDDLTFANANYVIGRDEWAYWKDPDTVNTIGEARTTFAVGAARRLARIETNLRLVVDEEEILPGIVARATYGHTPGHMAFEVGQGAERVMILGDCIGNHHMALRHPELPSGSDQDPEQGARTRVALLDQLAESQMKVLGFHLPGNGLGQFTRDGEGYRFIAAQ